MRNLKQSQFSCPGGTLPAMCCSSKNLGTVGAVNQVRLTSISNPKRAHAWSLIAELASDKILETQMTPAELSTRRQYQNLFRVPLAKMVSL